MTTAAVAWPESCDAATVVLLAENAAALHSGGLDVGGCIVRVRAAGTRVSRWRLFRLCLAREGVIEACEDAIDLACGNHQSVVQRRQRIDAVR